MALKSYKPTTPGQRGLVLIDRSELWKGRPVKALTEGLTKKAGRNNTGRITMRRRGGGAKRLYRIVDFKRTKWDMSRGRRADRIRSQPHRLHRADPVRGRRAELHPGAAAPGRRRQDRRRRAGRREAGQRDAVPGHADRHDRPQYRDEARQGRPDRARRGHLRPVRRPRRRLRADPAVARASCAWSARNAWRRSVRCRTPTTRTRTSARPGATVTTASGPVVRGVVMNPIDHPHGGGEGRTSGGRHPVTPWGKPTKGARTRDKNKASSKLILRSRHARKKRR